MCTRSECQLTHLVHLQSHALISFDLWSRPGPTFQSSVILPQAEAGVRFNENLDDQVTILMSTLDRLQEAGRSKTN